MQFADFKLKPVILQALRENGYLSPTAIQNRAIPEILDGNDVIGVARTGTGKTAAFAVPVLEIVAPKDLEQAVVLVPTRELATQVEVEFKKIASHMNFKIYCVHGGSKFVEQEKYLKKFAPQIVIGTPGRILEHLHAGNLYFKEIKVAVLDEADIMLDLGFTDDVRSIMRALVSNPQKLLFSATMRDDIRALAREFLDEGAIEIQESEDFVVDEVVQKYFMVRHSKKFDLLCSLLKSFNPQSGIIFMRTKAEAELVAKKLQFLNFSAKFFHGALNQEMRDRVLSEFKQGKFKFLVSSDVSARGLHLPLVSHIFNYSLPDDLTFYLHRIGRTARMGVKGTAITIISEGDMDKIKEIEQRFHTKLERTNLPSALEHANFATRLKGMVEVQKIEKQDRKQRYRSLAIKEWEAQRQRGEIKKQSRKSRTYSSLLQKARPGKKVTARMRKKGVR